MTTAPDPSARALPPWLRLAISRALPLVGSIALVALVCIVMGAPPIQVAGRLWEGAFGTADRTARVFATLAPLLLCASGLLFTFQAGLYNLGVEGQLVLGAIGAAGAARVFGGHLPGGAVIATAVAAAAIFGALWGVLTGALHTHGRVNEIFAGLGMNFVAQGVALYLIFGPWKRPGVASMAGTEPLDASLWLGTIGATDASPTALALAFVAVILTERVLRATHLGLRLRAVGSSPRAAEVLGVPAAQHSLLAFTISGGLAGVAGSIQVLGVFHRLIPNISSNLGFLGLLVVMLALFDARLVAPVALFFSALSVGSLTLPMTMQLESSLAGVLQGALVLFALLMPMAARGRRAEAKS